MQRARKTSSTTAPGLHETIALGDTARAIDMVKAGADPHQPNSQGLSPGQWACGFHGYSMLDRLHALGWMQTKDKAWTRQAARLAISADNAQALEWLINEGHDPDDWVMPQLMWSGLAYSANCLAINCMNTLFAAGADVQAIDRMGHGLIHLMAATARHDIGLDQMSQALKGCLSWGLDINLRDIIDGDTPAALAAFNQNLAMLQLLSDHGADPHARNTSGYGLIHAACQGPPDPVSGHMVSHLLGLGLEIDTPGVTHPVHFAAARNNPHALKSLAAHGACLEAPLCNNQAQTPVYTAMCSGSTEALKFLVDAGVRCDVVDRRGCGLLHLACGLQRITLPGMKQTLRTLVSERGLDPDRPSNSRITPLLHAAQEGSTQAMQTMLDLGASPTAVCLEARNLLHYAAQQAKCGPAELAILATPVAYRSQPDAHGHLPHELAYCLGHEQVGQVLEAAWSSSGLSRETEETQARTNPQRRL